MVQNREHPAHRASSNESMLKVDLNSELLPHMVSACDPKQAYSLLDRAPSTFEWKVQAQETIDKKMDTVEIQ